MEETLNTKGLFKSETTNRTTVIDPTCHVAEGGYDNLYNCVMATKKPGLHPLTVIIDVVLSCSLK